METFFLGAFVVGLTFVVASFVLGFAQADLPIPGLDHFDFGLFDGHGDLAGHDAGMSPFSVSTVTAFITWFGGIGYILSSQSTLPALLVVALSAVSGFGGATVVFLVLARLLLSGQTASMRPEDYRLEGTLARVSVSMAGSRIGEVMYSKHGTTRSEGARSVDGATLSPGAEVVILRYEKGIAYVQPLDTLLAERSTIPPGIPDRT